MKLATFPVRKLSSIMLETRLTPWLGECPTAPAGGARGGFGGSGGQECYKCGQVGHIARSCTQGGGFGGGYGGGRGGYGGGYGRGGFGGGQGGQTCYRYDMNLPPVVRAKLTGEKAAEALDIYRATAPRDRSATTVSLPRISSHVISNFSRRRDRPLEPRVPV